MTVRVCRGCESHHGVLPWRKWRLNHLTSKSIGWIKVAFTRVGRCSVRTAHVIRCSLLPGSPSSITNWSPTLHCAKAEGTKCANAASVNRVRSFLRCRSQSSAVRCDAAMSHPSLRIEQEIGCIATGSLLNASLGVWAASPLLLQQRY